MAQLARWMLQLVSGLGLSLCSGEARAWSVVPWQRLYRLALPLVRTCCTLDCAVIFYPKGRGSSGGRGVCYAASGEKGLAAAQWIQSLLPGAQRSGWTGPEEIRTLGR